MNHEKTIKRIQELTDGMALEEGCEVLFKEIESTTEAPFGRSGYVDVVTDTQDHPNEVLEGDVVVASSRIVVFRKNGSMEHREILCDNYKYQILGKPITLVVVLKAVEIVRKGFVVGTDGRFWQLQEVEDVLIFIPYKQTWNLSKDNFNDQSEETKSFIGELLN